MSKPHRRLGSTCRQSTGDSKTQQRADTDDADNTAKQSSSISLAQRLVPFLAMLDRCQAAKVDIVWSSLKTAAAQLPQNSGSEDTSMQMARLAPTTMARTGPTTGATRRLA